MGTESKERLAKKLILDTVEEALREAESAKDEKKRNAGRLAIEKEILDNLAVLGGRTFSEESIKREGSMLVIPANMTYRQAINHIKAVEESEEADTSFNRVFNYRPWDGAYCAANALKKLFGSVQHGGSPGWFGMSPPAMVTIPSGVGTTVQVPWGSFELPFLPGVVFQSHQSNHADKGPLYSLSAEGPRKFRYEVEGIFRSIEEELRSNSLYRGKAFDGQEDPEFIDIYSVDPDKVVYSKEVLKQLSANIWAQLKHPAVFKQKGIPFKRAVLIHGPFGTGKTLACMLTGQVAVANGVTFIKARPGRDNLSVVLQTARLYAPAVVFYEDIDGTTSAEDVDRTSMTRILDDFDGIEAKGVDVMMVLTTNYPEKIHAGMARPGRIDAFIEITELDQEGVEKLVRSRIEDDLAPNIDWEAVFAAAEGYKPAFVTEGADRTVRYMVNEYGEEIDGELVDTEQLVEAMEGLRAQYNKMIGAKDTQKLDPLSTALRREVGKEIIGVVPDLLENEFGWSRQS